MADDPKPTDTGEDPLTPTQFEAARILSAALRDFLTAAAARQPCDPAKQAAYVRRMDALASTREIPLSHGKVAVVDAADYGWLSQFRWYALRADQKDERWYAIRRLPKSQGRKTVYMHREIMAAPAGRPVDHADGNGLNNRRANIRLATTGLNNANKRSAPASGFRGVRKHGRRYQTVFAKKVVGSFATPEDAAKEYDRLALRHFREFARLNFPEAVHG